MTIACPAWSVKDVFAHLAGVSADIMSGNTEGAATEAWADAHVVARSDSSLGEILDEWETKGAEVTGVMAEAGEMFPYQLFVDQWTHEWDIRSALGARAAATPDTTVIEHFAEDMMQAIVERSSVTAASLEGLTLLVGKSSITLGAAPVAGTLELSPFEFGRIAVGRRSDRQLAQLDWPVQDNAGHLRAMTYWSVPESDINDPAI